MSNENRFPPITQLATVSLAGVVVGGILMASYAPRRPPLLVPTLLLGLSVVLLIVAALNRHTEEIWTWDLDRWTSR